MSLATRVIPILLQRGATLVKGTRFNSWRSVGHALQAVRIHNARGVDELCFLDIAATPEGRGPDFAMVSRLTADARMPITVGGGVRTVEDVQGLLLSGADKVAICTGTIISPTLVSDCAERFGAQAIVAAIDVTAREGKLRIAAMCGKRTSSFFSGRAGLCDWAKRLEKLGAGEILLTSIDREGLMQGYDLDLIKAVSEAVSIPVVANGGCSGYEDMLSAIKAGASAVAAGALFQFTDATPRAASEYLAAHGIEARV